MARRRGTRDRAACTRARRQRRRLAGRDRPAVRSGNRRRAVRGRAACAGPADVPRDRSRLLRPATGRRSALVPSPAAQPLRRRGARHGARITVRRRLERRSGAHSQARRQTSPLHRGRAWAARTAVGERPAPGPRLQAALRPAGGSLDAVVARASVRGDRLGTRLRPGGARPVGRAPPLREPPQADAARALLRGPARPGHRRLRRLHPRPAGRRSLTARGCLRGRRGRCRAAADDPRGEGARVQGRDRRRRRPRHRRSPVVRRDPRPSRRDVRLPRDRSQVRQEARGLQLRRGARGGEAGGHGRAAASLLRRDDARDRPADRLRRDRSRPPAGPGHADRLGARAARARR